MRKLGAPQNPEYAVGAPAEGGGHVPSERGVRDRPPPPRRPHLIERAEVSSPSAFAATAPSARRWMWRGGVAVVVDDGLATGRSAVAAVRSLRARGAARVVLAVPVAAPESLSALGREADEVVCVEAPEDMWAVGLWYEDFRPTSDAEVAALPPRRGLQPRSRTPARAGTPPTPAARSQRRAHRARAT